MPADSSNSTTAPRPAFPRLGVALSLLTESATHRAQLAALELGEARDHAMRSALIAAAAGVLLLLAGFALTLLLAALVWTNPDREWWLAGLTVLYLAGAATACRALVRRVREWEPLSETQNQLNQDSQCLRNLLNPANH